MGAYLGRAMNNRRKLVFALGVSALAVPFGSFAQQQGKVWRIGFLAQRRVDFIDSDYIYGPFRQGMRELGYVEGKNLVIEWRSAENKTERLPALAAELVRLKVDVIVIAGTPAAAAAQKAIVLRGAGVGHYAHYRIMRSSSPAVTLCTYASGKYLYSQPAHNQCLRRTSTKRSVGQNSELPFQVYQVRQGCASAS